MMMLDFRVERCTPEGDDRTLYAFVVLPALMESKIWMMRGLTIPCGGRQLWIQNAAVLHDGYTRITMRMRKP